MGAKAKILLVQHAQTQGNSAKRHLEGAGYSVVWAGSGVAALAAAKQQAADLIDMALPDIEGEDLCRRFRSRDATRTVPIILLTERGQTPSLISGRDGGPDDFLPKPYAEGELDAKIAAALSARAAVRTAGPGPRQETRPGPSAQPGMVPTQRVEPRPDPWPTAEQPKQTGQGQRTGTAAATPALNRAPAQTEKGHSEASPFGMAADEVVDQATGLFGRKQFEAMFSKEFKRSVRFKQQMSCMLIDLDGRKIGREGDAATIRAIIQLVQRTIREVDTAAWWSGEALIVLLPNTIRNDAVQAAARVLESVASHPFTWSDSSKVTMSIGVAGLPDRKIDSEQKLIEAATAACRRARDLMLPDSGK
jgi:diguanylate cyclase (GGDEF)-like protein